MQDPLHLDLAIFRMSDGVRLAQVALLLLLALLVTVVFWRWPAPALLPVCELDVRAEDGF